MRGQCTRKAQRPWRVPRQSEPEEVQGPVQGTYGKPATRARANASVRGDPSDRAAERNNQGARTAEEQGPGRRQRGRQGGGAGAREAQPPDASERGHRAQVGTHRSSKGKGAQRAGQSDSGARRPREEPAGAGGSPSACLHAHRRTWPSSGGMTWRQHLATSCRPGTRGGRQPSGTQMAYRPRAQPRRGSGQRRCPMTWSRLRSLSSTSSRGWYDRAHDSKSGPTGGTSRGSSR